MAGDKKNRRLRKRITELEGLLGELRDAIEENLPESEDDEEEPEEE